MQKAGTCKDYTEMQWRILQQKKPDDYVIATGKAYSVREFINIASKYLKMKVFWKGHGLDEIGYIKKNGKKEGIIKIDKKYFRPNEVDYLIVNADRAFKILNLNQNFHLLIW